MNIIISWILLLLVNVTFGQSYGHSNLEKMRTVYKWKYVDYLWPPLHQRDPSVNYEYIPQNMIPLDFAKAPGKKIILDFFR